MRALIALLAVAASIPVGQAQAARKHTYEYKVRNAPVTYAWEPVLAYYTGGYYGVDLVNTMWQNAPHGKRRQAVLDAAMRYHVPLRLLLGVWGVESGYGRAWNNFGLIGPANGDVRHDAFISAKLFSNTYWHFYHRHAV